MEWKELLNEENCGMKWVTTTVQYPSKRIMEWIASWNEDNYGMKKNYGMKGIIDWKQLWKEIYYEYIIYYNEERQKWWIKIERMKRIMKWKDLWNEKIME